MLMRGKRMTIKQLAVKLCKKEGLKKQVNVAQMQEVLGALSDLVYAQIKKANIDIIENPKQMNFFIIDVLCLNGAKRAKKKDKKVARTVK